MFSLNEIHLLILEKADKIGSDYFPLDVVRNRFISETYKYLNEVVKAIEITQQISDKIKPLVVPKTMNVISDPALSGVIAPLPNDYFHLLRINPIFREGVTSRKSTVIRHGSSNVTNLDPYNKPTMEYPVITQYANVVNVNTGGQESPIKVLFIYIKKPIFAELNAAQERIVNLPDDVILDIVDLTVIELFQTSIDIRSSNQQQQQ